MDATELTLKQILDSAWVRRLARAAMLLMFPTISLGGGVVGWIILQNYETAAKAALLAEDAAEVAAAVSAKQDSRAALADLRAGDEKAWRDRLDAGLTRVNNRLSTEVGRIAEDLGEIKGAIGEVRGLILRGQAASGIPTASGTGAVLATQVEIPR